MARDYTTGTKVDPGSRFSVATNTITVTALPRNESAYIYWDMGAAGISGDFHHDVDINITSASGTGVMLVWAVANNIGDEVALRSYDHLHVQVNTSGSAATIFLNEYYATTNYSSSYAGTTGTNYYLRVRYASADSTYGTLYLDIYSNAARTTLITTKSLVLHAVPSNQYLYAVDSSNPGVADSITGTISNLTITTDMAATLTSTSTVTANLPTLIEFVADLTSVSTFTADLTTSIKLVSALSSISTLTANLTTVGLYSSPSSISTLTADLTTAITMSAALSSTSTMVASLATGSPGTLGWRLQDTSGNLITGASALITLKIGRYSDSTIYDWNDTTFKTSGWTSISTTMGETDSTNLPGEYRKIVDWTTWSDDIYYAFVDYAGSPSQHREMDLEIKNGQLVSTYTSNRVASIPTNPLLATDYTVPDNPGIAANGTAIATMQTGVTRLLGFAGMENLVEDNEVRDANGNKVSSMLYIYDSKANAQLHDKATGLIGSLSVSATFVSGLATLFKSLKES